MPRLLKPTQEIEPPAPLTPEMRGTLDRTFRPMPEPKHHPLPADFEEKREAELEKMGLANGQQKTGWQPDLSITASLGLEGKTALEIAAELGKKPISDEAALKTVVDINNRLEAYFENEEEIPLVAEEPDPHLVPLAEQKTEEEEAHTQHHPFGPGVTVVYGAPASEEEEDARMAAAPGRGRRVPARVSDVSDSDGADEEDTREGPQSLLQQVAPRPVIEGRPWSKWSDPVTVTAPLHHFSVTAEGETLALVLQPDNQLATVTAEALSALGRRCAFPPEFVAKLPARIVAEVVNDRISVVDNNDTTVLLQNGQWTAILPAWRGVVPYRVVCDTVYDTLAEHYSGIEVDRLETNGMLHLRLLTPVAYPVTESDTLQMGVDVTFSYNTTLTVSLLVRRQDGAEMTAYPQSFSWRQRTGDGGSAERQIEWLQQAVLYAIGMYTTFVANAIQAAAMAVTPSDLRLTLEQLRISKKEAGRVSEVTASLLTNFWEMCGDLALYALAAEGQADLQATLGAYIANWGE